MKKLLFSVCLLLLFQSLHSQCFADRHNTSLADSWISCDRRSSPNTNRGFTHFIQYEFDQVRTIEGLKFWNINHPDALDDGAREIIVDISMDGSTWTEHATIDLGRATGLSTYEGEDIIDMTDLTARFILMTMKSNHGGQCVGFSEVRFNLADQTTPVEDVSAKINISAYPNPFSEQINVELTDISPGDVQYQLIAPNGQTIYRSKPIRSDGSYSFVINGKNLAEGNYFLKVLTEDGFGIENILVFHPN